VQNPLQQPQRLPLQQQQPQQQRGVACRGLFGLGLPEIAVIAGVAALIFGPSKLPELGKGLGKTVKSFQTAANEFKSELEAATKDDDEAGAGAAAGNGAAAASKEGDKAASGKAE
jgi:sec-independent protein translocase protein TatA